MNESEEAANLQAMEDCYTQPISTSGEDNSDVHTLGRVNHSFLSSDAEMESSFSDEQKLSSAKPYTPKLKGDSKTAPVPSRSDSKELGLPPPPGSLWLPVGQSHSADGIITGGYPSLVPTYPYIHPSMMHASTHPSMHSLESTTSLTAEEHELILKLRQEKLRNKQRGSTSPDEDGRHLYEELPGYQYKTHRQMRSLPSPLDRRAPPHLPPVSSLPSSSQASGLDKVDEEIAPRNNNSRPRKDNPLYELGDSPTMTKVAPGETGRESYKNHSQLDYFSRGRCRCYCILVMLVAVMAAVALSISLITFLGASDAQAVPAPRTSLGAITDGNITEGQVKHLAEQVTLLMTQTRKQGKDFEELTDKLADLEREKTDLQAQLRQLNQELRAALNETSHQFEVVDATLQNSDGLVEVLGSQIYTVNNSLTNAIESVSKMPGPAGPQGPSGLLNTSLCHHSYKQYPTDGPYTHSVYSDPVSDTATTKVMAASCSWLEYGGVTLNVSESNGFKTYRCQCSRGLKEVLNCRIDYWICDV